jgi:hypothetical protein
MVSQVLTVIITELENLFVPLVILYISPQLLNSSVAFFYH